MNGFSSNAKTQGVVSMAGGACCSPVTGLTRRRRAKASAVTSRPREFEDPRTRWSAERRYTSEKSVAVFGVSPDRTRRWRRHVRREAGGGLCSIPRHWKHMIGDWRWDDQVCMRRRIGHQRFKCWSSNGERAKSTLPLPNLF